MFKKLGAVSQRKIYVGFNEKNEKCFPIEVDGYKVLDGFKTEALSNFCVTESGNYIGGYFVDVCSDNMPFPAVGFFLKANGKILLNGDALTENKRVKITQSDEAIITGEDYNCCFYPIIEDKNDYFLEYDKDENSVGIISVHNGSCENDTRVILKFGCAFSQGFEFIKDNAEVKFYPKCSIKRIIGDE